MFKSAILLMVSLKKHLVILEIAVFRWPDGVFFLLMVNPNPHVNIPKSACIKNQRDTNVCGLVPDGNIPIKLRNRPAINIKALPTVSILLSEIIVNLQLYV